MDMGLALYKFADALHLDLKYEAGKVKGSTPIIIKTPLGLELKGTVKALKIFANETVGLLVHVMGDLYMVAAYYQKTGATTLFIVDGNKLSMDGVKSPPELFISGTMGLREVVDSIKPSIVGSFVWSSGVWKTLDLV